MVKTYCNTRVFDHLIVGRREIEVTTVPEEAGLLVLGAKKIDFRLFPRLKAVYRFGVGTENLDIPYLSSRGITMNLPGERAKEILYESAADFTVYGILRLLMDGACGDIETWRKTERDHLGHKTALVIGVGHIGRSVAEKLNPFMKVTTFDIQADSLADLQPLLRVADVVTVHIPLTDANRGFFDREKLSLIKDDAVMANTARGEIFDEDALYEKLANSRCRAFFDVFWQEPYKGRLKDLGPSKFFMTPHSASQTREFVLAGFQDMLKVAQGLEGSA